jgi:hypothetical protein
VQAKLEEVFNGCRCHLPGSQATNGRRIER